MEEEVHVNSDKYVVDEDRNKSYNSNDETELLESFMTQNEQKTSGEKGDLDNNYDNGEEVMGEEPRI